MGRRFVDAVGSFGLYIVIGAVVIAFLIAVSPDGPTKDELEQQLEEVTDERDELQEEVNRLEERVSALNGELEASYSELSDYNDLELFSMDALQVFAGEIVGRLDSAKDYIADNDLEGAIYSIDIAIDNADALLDYCE